MKDSFETFIGKALDIVSKDSELRMSDEEMKAVALRAGLSEEDWKRLCEELEAHLSRGKRFLKFRNGADAVNEFEQALLLAPYRVDVLADCAKAHHLNWEQNSTAAPNSRDRASELYGRCLQLEPTNDEAAEGLSRLNSHEIRRVERRRWLRIRLAFVMTVILLLACGFLGWRALNPNSITYPIDTGETVAWKWGSGGILKLSPDGSATHSTWSVAGEWERISDDTIKLVNHENHVLMIITMRPDGSGDVIAEGGRMTVITPLKSEQGGGGKELPAAPQRLSPTSP